MNTSENQPTQAKRPRIVNIILTLLILLSLANLTLSLYNAQLQADAFKLPMTYILFSNILGAALNLYLIRLLSVGTRWPISLMVGLSAIHLLHYVFTHKFSPTGLPQSQTLNPLVQYLNLATIANLLCYVTLYFSSNTMNWVEQVKMNAFQKELLKVKDENYHLYLVSPKKIAVLMVVTLGLYLFWWQYKHWKNAQKNENDNNSTKLYLRTILFPISIYPLAKRILSSKKESITYVYYTILAFSSILVYLTMKGHDLILPCFASFFTLFSLTLWYCIVQSNINHIVQMSGTSRAINDRFNWINITGILLFVFAIIFLTINGAP